MRLFLLLFLFFVFSAHGGDSNIIYEISILFVAVMNTTISADEPGNQTHTRTISKVIYISLGATSAILLLSIPVFAWCYRKAKLKNIERFMWNAFQTKMWCSNLVKFRRELVLDAENV